MFGVICWSESSSKINDSTPKWRAGEWKIINPTRDKFELTFHWNEKKKNTSTCSKDFKKMEVLEKKLFFALV